MDLSFEKFVEALCWYDGQWAYVYLFCSSHFLALNCESSQEPAFVNSDAVLIDSASSVQFVG